MSRYHFVYHGDLDGMVSAALFLRNISLTNNNYQLHCMESFQRHTLDSMINKLNLKDDDRLFIVDYAYHPRADVWVDHHFDPKFGEDVIHNSRIKYDHRAKSAARIVYNFMNDGVGGNVINMVDMIDSAEYPTCEKVFCSSEPILILNAYISMLKDYDGNIRSRIIESIISTDFVIEDAMWRMKIDSSHGEAMRDAALKSRQYTTIFQNTSLIMQRRPDQFPRYSEYLSFPGIQYAMRISPLTEVYSKVQIGFNPWFNKPNELNIGELLRNSQFVQSGGGHFNVGGGTIRKCDIDDFVESIVGILNKETDMEKYAVDQSDDVEQAANLLVKTGAAKTIDEARAKSVTQEEVKDGGRDNNSNSTSGGSDSASTSPMV